MWKQGKVRLIQTAVTDPVLASAGQSASTQCPACITAAVAGIFSVKHAKSVSGSCC